jgi:O-antigen biosynthesis protein
VIITTHNRPRLLRRCVASVLAQDFPPDRHAILVVDDGSRRPASRVLAPHIATGRIRCLRQHQQGWGRARLTGVQHTQAEIVVFLDDDCIAPPGWLAQITAGYAAHPNADGIAGGLRPGAQVNVAGRKQYLGHLAYFNRMNAPLGTHTGAFGRAWFTFGGNRSFRRAVWLAAYDEARAAWYYDDMLLDLALRERGAVIYYDPAAWVTHHYWLSVPQRVRAAYRYGRAEGQVPPHAAQLVRQDAPAAGSLRDRWAQLRRETPDAAWQARAGYALTQPLVRLAYWIGRIVSKRLAMT